RNTFFAGAILTVCIVQLPQRFATVNGDTAFQAAVKLLPFGVSIPAGSVFAATIIGRVGVAPQTTSPGPGLPNAHYGYQILTGTGVGFFNAALVLMVPYILEQRDLASSTGTQRPTLLHLLPPEQFDGLFESTRGLSTFSEVTQSALRWELGKGYNMQMKVLIAAA
ncbi:MAG: hypothetical protein LQ338_006209, partial [Usnochroma carphineum]